MFQRGCVVLVFVFSLVTLASARPKRLHYDDAPLREASEFEPEESPRPQPTPAVADPLAVAHDLACEPLVIHAFLMAWKSTLDGTRNHGLAETGFAIQSYKSSTAIQSWRDVAMNHILIPINGDTVAVAHVHGEGVDEHPSGPDTRSSIPNFVISKSALYVTVPGSTRTMRVRGGVLDADGWDKHCSSNRLSLTAKR